MIASLFAAKIAASFKFFLPIDVLTASSNEVLPILNASFILIPYLSKSLTNFAPLDEESLLPALTYLASFLEVI